jgi:hypothetical protein
MLRLAGGKRLGGLLFAFQQVVGLQTDEHLSRLDPLSFLNVNVPYAAADPRAEPDFVRLDESRYVIWLLPEFAECDQANEEQHTGNDDDCACDHTCHSPILAGIGATTARRSSTKARPTKLASLVATMHAP